ncbi:glycosyltransferase family 9 protein, partial [Verrucomicrobiota bacterium]
GRMLNDSLKCSILVLGSASERELCGRVARTIGPSAVDLAGQTTLPELAAALSLCALVIANDSGGMHLATAVGTPVVAVFGITDPAKTGPMGEHVCVLQDSPVQDRDLDRESEIAAMSLSRIRPEHVFEAVCKQLGGMKHKKPEKDGDLNRR